MKSNLNEKSSEEATICWGNYIPNIYILLCKSAPCWSGISWLWRDDKTLPDLREANHALDPIPALRLAPLSFLLRIWWTSDRRKTSHKCALITSEGASRAGTERQKPCQAHWSTDEERGLIAVLQTRCAAPPPSHFPATGGINPCSTLWDGSSSPPTALHFIHHWMHTHKAGSMMVPAASARLFPSKLERHAATLMLDTEYLSTSSLFQ